MTFISVYDSTWLRNMDYSASFLWSSGNRATLFFYKHKILYLQRLLVQIPSVYQTINMFRSKLLPVALIFLFSGIKKNFLILWRVFNPILWYEGCQSQVGNDPCQRTCNDGPPQTCIFNFTAHFHFTMSKACYECPKPSRFYTHCYLPDCITAEGSKRPVVVINGQMPGPSIQVFLKMYSIESIFSGIHRFVLEIK